METITTQNKTIAQAGNQSIVLTRLGQEKSHFFSSTASIAITTEALRLSHDNAVIDWNCIKQVVRNGNATTFHYDWEGTIHILIVFGDMGELIEAVWLTQRTNDNTVEDTDFGKIISGVEKVMCSTLTKNNGYYTFHYDGFNTDVVVYENGIKCYEYGQLKVQVPFSQIQQIQKLYPATILYYITENSEELELHLQSGKLYNTLLALLPTTVAVRV